MGYNLKAENCNTEETRWLRYLKFSKQYFSSLKKISLIPTQTIYRISLYFLAIISQLLGVWEIEGKISPINRLGWT